MIANRVGLTPHSARPKTRLFGLRCADSGAESTVDIRGEKVEYQRVEGVILQDVVNEFGHLSIAQK